ncbi:Mo-dependent nitrogenase C-terminal domain-containing protein [Oculatella sp. LEGE 06141]|uniref:Mo-dependent nitrogenase C-terminal domain-containing protein n=1 Tax=Oculatella sp. LEGE 06141 TaxID=1828648 RepID=UPI0018804F60|nr:Mo-dependent nitrogenase C-terminal domain-containing protein [Oculatella sp. LEGE 06141]MBE9181435.1 Mo-dependent nitrogenase C-terminal domain-containing protein [Oculatella sp. LEGE 06141]
MRPSSLDSRAMKPQSSVLNLVRQWLDDIEIRDARLARCLSRLIPSQCPFERDINLFGRTVAHIPPLCKLNPFYEQFVGLRFRSLCFLVDVCGEDIQSYC